MRPHSEFHHSSGGRGEIYESQALATNFTYWTDDCINLVPLETDECK